MYINTVQSESRKDGGKKRKEDAESIYETKYICALIQTEYGRYTTPQIEFFQIPFIYDDDNNDDDFVLLISLLILFLHQSNDTPNSLNHSHQITKLNQTKPFVPSNSFLFLSLSLCLSLSLSFSLPPRTYEPSPATLPHTQVRRHANRQAGIFLDRYFQIHFHFHFPFHSNFTPHVPASRLQLI